MLGGRPLGGGGGGGPCDGGLAPADLSLDADGDAGGPALGDTGASIGAGRLGGGGGPRGIPPCIRELKLSLCPFTLLSCEFWLNMGLLFWEGGAGGSDDPFNVGLFFNGGGGGGPALFPLTLELKEGLFCDGGGGGAPALGPFIIALLLWGGGGGGPPPGLPEGPLTLMIGLFWDGGGGGGPPPGRPLGPLDMEAGPFILGGADPGGFSAVDDPGAGNIEKI